MKVINFRLGNLDEATFNFCKKYLEEENEKVKALGLPTKKITNSDVIRAGLNLLWDKGRISKCNKKTE